MRFFIFSKILKSMLLASRSSVYSAVFHMTTNLHFRDRINIEYMCNINITLTLETEGVRIQSEKQAHLYTSPFVFGSYPDHRYMVPVISRNKAEFFLIGTVMYKARVCLHAGFFFNLIQNGYYYNHRISYSRIIFLIKLYIR